MQYLKNTNNKTYIQWNVESGSGFFTVVAQNDMPNPPSGSTGFSGGKMVTISLFSGSVSSFPPVGQQINNWEVNNIHNPNFVTVDKTEYDNFLSSACTNVQSYQEI
jgi:hypothetical protein